MSLQRYLGDLAYENLTQEWKERNNNFLKITCIGFYNNGKSTLLNALIDDFENQTFQVSDKVETKENKEFQKENIIYVDSPGLNATVEDDEKVLEAIMQSDINLFIHNITSGAFTKKEVEFLKFLKAKYDNNKDFLQNTIFVLSQIDNLKEEEDIKRTKDDIQEQLKNTFGENANIIPVSSLRYIKGKNENKELLIKKSNIETLKTEISNFLENIKTIKDIKESKYLKNLQDMQEKIQKELNEENKIFINYEKDELNRQKLLNAELIQIYETLKNKKELLAYYTSDNYGNAFFAADGILALGSASIFGFKSKKYKKAEQEAEQRRKEEEARQYEAKKQARALEEDIENYKKQVISDIKYRFEFEISFNDNDKIEIIYDDKDDSEFKENKVKILELEQALKDLEYFKEDYDIKKEWEITKTNAKLNFEIMRIIMEGTKEKSERTTKKLSDIISTLKEL